MFNTFGDLDRTFRMMEDLRRRMDSNFPWQPPSSRSLVGRLETAEDRGPSTEWHETDEAFILIAELPGVSKEQVELAVESDQLRLKAERRVSVPEGYTSIMEERPAWAFEQTFALPARIDTARVDARLEGGVLEIVLPKHPDAKPRHITIRSA